MEQRERGRKHAGRAGHRISWPLEPDLSTERSRSCWVPERGRVGGQCSPWVRTGWRDAGARTRAGKGGERPWGVPGVIGLGLLYSENLQHPPLTLFPLKRTLSDCTSAPDSPFDRLECSSRPTSTSVSLLLCD